MVLFLAQILASCAHRNNLLEGIVHIVPVLREQKNLLVAKILGI